MLELSNQSPWEVSIVHCRAELDEALIQSVGDRGNALIDQNLCLAVSSLQINDVTL